MASDTDKEFSLPIIPNRGEGFFFPFQNVNILIGRETSKKAIDASIKDYGGKIIIGFLQNTEAMVPTNKDIFPICVLASVVTTKIQENGIYSVEFLISKRLKLEGISTSPLMYLVADAYAVSDRDIPWKTQYTSFLENLREKIQGTGFDEQMREKIASIISEEMSPSEFCFRLAPLVARDKKIGRKILATDSVIERMQTIQGIFDLSPISIESPTKPLLTSPSSPVLQSTWEKIDSCANFVLFSGVGIALLFFICGIVVAITTEMYFLILVGIVVAAILGISSYVISIMIQGYSEIVRNNEQQFEDRNTKK